NVVSDSTTFSDDDLRSKVTALAFMRGTDEEVSTIQRLSEQFGEREEFQVLVMTVENGFNEELRNVRVMSMTQNAAKQFFHTHLTDTIEFSTPSFALIDTAGHIRRLYSGEPVQPLSRKLVEHIATVLPRTRKSDIIHKDLIDEE
ncbi:MAG: hypothetical protein R3275_13870, partial [Saprospiraceae bacterium]|nr:hypothetical protein [Saprospiraceae bacterium]